MAKLPDKKTIKELADLLADTGLSEIEVETGEVRIRVARQGVGVNAVVPAPIAAAPAPVAAAEAPAPAELAGALKSPMVGTAYLSPEPGVANFVKVGDSVSKGQTLLIVEAMKTMNPIAANKSGKITQIIVGNEQPVEFDEVLMVIE
tara:strand:+ start:701 stop:1141 length:441 start_codon:yes stop_codon:yes gene_type:complete